MANILDAILNIAKDSSQKLSASTNKHNRLHAAGEPLEEYIKDAFAGTFSLDTATKISKQSQVFSYGGGKNNPPDAIIKNGDAIEVKKVETIGDIPLNSSYPKAKLYHDDPRISSDCRNIEGGQWTERDIIYAVGNVKAKGADIYALTFVYGSIYCAKKECYETTFNAIKEGIIKSVDLELEPTNELAHINMVDPLGITYFRARGMWGITHPLKVFKYLFQHDSKNRFELVAIIPTDKYDNFENKSNFEQEAQKINALKIENKQVKNPNNTAELINVKLITYVL